MKKIYLLSGLLCSALFYSQSLVGGLNSGGVSGENLIHTVGEIYVVPTNPDEQNSGTLGVLSQTVLTVLGVNEVITNQEKVNVYPNPTADYITISVSSKTKPKEVSIYDMSGKLVSQKEIKDNRIDLSFLTKGVYMLMFKNLELKPVKIIKK
ncbi:T9SS C-terminal target domain-containing protein [Chryseobacterium sp. G0186]|uniref:T9SS type A sorting domain-containing protein n=1 Tax=Chryseobacterium sp. G0186 TaxID=2487064 RepID=UPI000F4DC11C|nr:T9SS type A sorting domain-containing protein [Chryseobacterium sp. G0186]AZA78576.1 T9SS C-terminal target domain-containing protein [Chryseobacterium sp. G0186]